MESIAKLAKAALIIVLLVCGAKFYHYNYIEHTRGEARTLKDDGLRELVCKGVAYKSGEVDQCGRRAIYGDADWGVTAYLTIYGVETLDEAEAIAKFLVEARKRNRQERIPIKLEVYSTPRSAGARPSAKKIFDKSL